MLDNTELSYPDFDSFQNKFYPISINKRDTIYAVSFSKEIRGRDYSNLFLGFKNLEEFNHFPENFNNCTSLHGMFNFCEKFNQDIYIENNNEPLDISFMFNNCKNFNSKVFLKQKNNLSNSVRVFSGCNSINLENLKLNYENLGLEKDDFYKQTILNLTKKEFFNKI